MTPDSHTTQAAWELPEAVWRRIAPWSPPRTSTAGRPQTVDLTRITAGIFSVLRTGIPWQACPRERVGPPSTVSDDFRPWVTAGGLGHWWTEALTVYDDLQGWAWTWQSGDGALTQAPVGARPRALIPRTVASAGRSAACCRRAKAFPVRSSWQGPIDTTGSGARPPWTSSWWSGRRPPRQRRRTWAWPRGMMLTSVVRWPSHVSPSRRFGPVGRNRVSSGRSRATVLAGGWWRSAMHG